MIISDAAILASWLVFGLAGLVGGSLWVSATGRALRQRKADEAGASQVVNLAHATLRRELVEAPRTDVAGPIADPLVG